MWPQKSVEIALAVVWSGPGVAKTRKLAQNRAVELLQLGSSVPLHIRARRSLGRRQKGVFYKQLMRQLLCVRTFRCVLPAMLLRSLNPFTCRQVGRTPRDNLSIK